MDQAHGNIYADLGESSAGEIFRDLLTAPHFKIERIVSMGQATPPGEWLDQDRAEWVILLAGTAALLFEGDAALHPMKQGDYLLIPPHHRHRVEWTAQDEPTVWLAVHYDS